jgi:hypothetical protein
LVVIWSERLARSSVDPLKEAATALGRNVIHDDLSETIVPDYADSDTGNPCAYKNKAPTLLRRRSGQSYRADRPTVPCVFTIGGGFHLPVSASDSGA